MASLSDERKLAVLSYSIERFGGSPTKENHNGDKGFQPNDQRDTDIKSFLKKKDPKNKYQQVAVLAYFLKKNSGTDEVNKEIIESANTQAGGRTIDDITATLNDAKLKYGFFGAGSGGKKILLAYGEDIVEALPDKEKVKELMKKNSGKSKRRSKKGKASKK